MTDTDCSECYDAETVLWRGQPANEMIREYMNTYVGPVKIYYLTLEDALEAWESDNEIS